MLTRTRPPGLYSTTITTAGALQSCQCQHQGRMTQRLCRPAQSSARTTCHLRPCSRPRPCLTTAQAAEGMGTAAGEGVLGRGEVPQRMQGQMGALGKVASHLAWLWKGGNACIAASHCNHSLLCQIYFTIGQLLERPLLMHTFHYITAP
jgi:hypothetical protein